MLKRALTLASLVLTLAAPSGLMDVQAQSSGGPPIGEKKSCEVCTTEPCRSIEDIRAASTFDRAGRFSTTTVPSPDGRGADISFEFEYDGHGRLTSISGSNGGLALFEYSFGENSNAPSSSSAMTTSMRSMRTGGSLRG